ncbi:hypothetical protein BN2127_JRS7_02608 [Bacillus subtilis]|nr:hypothetical protein BN2127_JRS1_07854 [Bacillus cereus]CUB41576.1 hypothetical protein BN2127_JRS7_02608 [Bacillus subtilis]
MKKISFLFMLCLAAVFTILVPVHQADAAEAPYKASITNISTDGGVYGKINYGQGQFWRVKYNITISGKLLDQNGQPVPNAPVRFEQIRKSEIQYKQHQEQPMETERLKFQCIWGQLLGTTHITHLFPSITMTSSHSEFIQEIQDWYPLIIAFIISPIK